MPQDFEPDKYDERTADLLDEVYNVFGQYSAWKLRNMTHEERPWVEAYEGGERGRVISHRSMREFYRDFVTD